MEFLPSNWSLHLSSFDGISKLLEQSDENQIKDLLRMKLSEQGYSLLIALELGNDLSSLSYVQIDAQGNITAVKNHDVGDGGTTISVGIYVKASDMNRIQMLYNLEIDWAD